MQTITFLSNRMAAAAGALVLSLVLFAQTVSIPQSVETARSISAYAGGVA